jgi:hypothetical protein
MDGTERRVLVVGTIACLLALSALAGAASSAAVDGAPPDSSPLPGSPAAFAERASGARDDGPAAHGQASFRNALELMILVATCGIVVAFYSAFSGGQGRKRVLMRIRRR